MLGNNGETKQESTMRKFILLAAAALAISVALCSIAWFAAPVAAGAAMLFQGVNLLSKPLGIPGWLAGLIFLALLPSAILWLLRVFSAQVRKWVAVVLIVAAVIYGLVAAVLSNQHLNAAAHNAATSIQKFLVPVKPANPATEAWFDNNGRPRLYFARSATNSLAFYWGAYPGACDPDTGVKLQAVTPELRIEWQAEQTRERDAETAKVEKAERLALEVQRQQLESLSDSLHKQNVALQDERQSILTNLLQRLETKQQQLTEAEAKMPNSPLQSVSDACQKLAVARAMLMETMTNNSSVDMAVVQAEFQAATSNVDLAEGKIQAASAAAAEKERQQAEANTSKDALSHQPDPVASQNASAGRQSQNQIGLRNKIRHWLGEDSIATVSIQNTTSYTLYITFSSPRWQHIWPEQGRAFLAEPGQTITVRLAGTPGEEIFYKAWAAQNQNFQWGNCDCGPDGQPSPIAICGDNDPPLLRLVE
jgi:hypothetical protein